MSAPAEPVDPMLCLGCDYDLHATAAGPCPECGRAFDPADPLTWGIEPARRPRRWMKVAAVLLAPGPLWGLLGMVVEYVLAWVVLGRPPQPSGDDPLRISWVTTGLHMVVAVLLLGSPLIAWSGVALAIGGVASRHDRVFWWSVLAGAILAWPLAYAASTTPIAKSIGSWWMD